MITLILIGIMIYLIIGLVVIYFNEAYIRGFYSSLMRPDGEYMKYVAYIIERNKIKDIDSYMLRLRRWTYIYVNARYVIRWPILMYKNYMLWLKYFLR